MAISRQQKEEITKQLADDLSKAKSVVVSSFSQISVDTDQVLRGELREANVGYQIVKKTLIKKALAAAKLEEIDLSNVTGNVTVATAVDEISAAKVLHKFASDNEGATVVAGFLESVLIDGAKISELALLPSKQELIAKTLATINAPIQNFVGVLGGLTRNLVYVLSSIKEQKE